MCRSKERRWRRASGPFPSGARRRHHADGLCRNDVTLEAQKYLKMTMLTTKMVTMMITQTAEDPGAVLDQDLVGRLRAAIRSQLSVGLLFYFANSAIW